MKYLCLIYRDADVVTALSDDEHIAIRSATVEYGEELKERGHFIVSQALQPIEAAVTIRGRDGELTMTEGPYAEAKSQLSEFVLIRARDLNDAIRVAAKIPSLRLGCIEIRPVDEAD